MAEARTSSALGDFLRENYVEILPRWLSAVRECTPAMRLPEPLLVDHLPAVLHRIAEAADRIARGDWSEVPKDATVDHAMNRLADGFDLQDVLTEFFLLRHVLLEFVLGTRRPSDPVGESQLLSWAVDATVRESVAAFTAATQLMLNALDRISAESLAGGSLDELLQRLLQAVLDATRGVDIACLLLVGGDRLVHRVAVGLAAADHRAVSVAVGEGLVGRVVAERRPMSASSTECEGGREGTFLREQGIRAQYAVPLLANGNVFGVVQIGSRLERFTEAETALLRTAATRMGAAVYERRLREDAERAAREREQALWQQEMAIDAARMGLWRFDLAANMFRFDRRFAGIAGIDGTECSYDELTRLVHPDDLPRLVAAMEQTTSSSMLYAAEYRITRASGEERWIEAHGRGVTEGAGLHPRTVAIVGTVVDITDRKRAEEALQAANRQLVEADQRKNEFLAVLSHELRNPLAPIRNSVYILDRATPGGTQANRAREVIERQVGHMTRLIDDLLDVTRISRGKINLQRERVNLNELALRTAEDHRGAFAASGITLEVHAATRPLWVHGDPTRLAQIIGNLLSNSAKFTLRGGKTIMSLASRHRQVVVRVQDNGIGMTSETMAHLFEPFMQGAQTIERTRGGLGLGLALVKGLVEMHGGRITAHSEGNGKGAEFTLTLPLRAPTPDVAEAPTEKRSWRGQRILVVEDNADAADSLREALELGNHQVVVAHSGTKGVEIARRFKPDVVLCDIGLPGMDGYDVARAIRADQDAIVRSTFLVALSGYAQEEDVVKSKEAGFDRHVAKPPSIEAIESLLREAPVSSTAD